MVLFIVVSLRDDLHVLQELERQAPLSTRGVATMVATQAAGVFGARRRIS